MLLGLQELSDGDAELTSKIEKTIDYLATSRPTAVNLFWALERMRGKLREVAGEENVGKVEIGSREASHPLQIERIGKKLLAEARRIHEEDRKCVTPSVGLGRR